MVIPLIQSTPRSVPAPTERPLQAAGPVPTPAPTEKPLIVGTVVLPPS